ncbi:MAG TPA: hypothetical protein VGG34_02315 [Opitutaceae bacterium]|jgi:hypothetical protein
MNDNPTTKTLPMTLTEFCGVDDALFENYLERKAQFLQQLDEKAEARICAALEEKLAWVA